MRLLPALALLVAAAPASAQRDPAPPTLPESLELDDGQREQLRALRGRMESLRLRLSTRDSVAVAPRCGAGLPLPTPFDGGGAAPAPMPEVGTPGPGPAPMPNLCAGGGVAVLSPRRFPVPPGRVRWILPVPPRVER